MLDQIEDPELRLKMYELCLQQAHQALPVQEKPSLEILQPNYYNFKEVLNGIQNPIRSTVALPVSIHDLLAEVNLLKQEIKEIRTHQHLQYLKLQSIKRTQDHSQPSSSKGKEKENSSEQMTNQYLMLLNQVTYHKWYIKITVVINDTYVLQNAITLLDSGAELFIGGHCPIRILGKN